ncbi:MAG: hypothetical protein GC191_16015 [Azospirillum sp.]|nr:hypothetical protein [Azospirillum sp.]
MLVPIRAVDSVVITFNNELFVAMAALWLAFRGRHNLIRNAVQPLPFLFKNFLRTSACRPAGWDAENWGWDADQVEKSGSGHAGYCGSAAMPRRASWPRPMAISTVTPTN